jgi:Uri superfamily endonuclease
VAEKRLYEKHISASIKKKDGWKIDLFTAKCSNISAHLNQAMLDLRMALRASMRTKFKKLTLMIK